MNFKTTQTMQEFSHLACSVFVGPYSTSCLITVKLFSDHVGLLIVVSRQLYPRSLRWAVAPPSTSDAALGIACQLRGLHTSTYEGQRRSTELRQLRQTLLHSATPEQHDLARFSSLETAGVVCLVFVWCLLLLLRTRQ